MATSHSWNLSGWSLGVPRGACGRHCTWVPSWRPVGLALEDEPVGIPVGLSGEKVWLEFLWDYLEGTLVGVQ
jgi:hypothetical protein